MQIKVFVILNLSFKIQKIELFSMMNWESDLRK